ncbi:MAG TPA: amidase, partial [Polyangiaceae bacterium]|nr:amidase [Polyangiaceae bacterium]
MSIVATRSGLELAALVRRREVSPLELVDDVLDRVRRFDGRLSAFVDMCARQARLEARTRTMRIMAPSIASLPPLYGVPTGIKDLNPVRGTMTRFGSRAFRHLFTPFDDVSTQVVRQSGMVIVGKLATSEFGAVPVTEPLIHPPTRNPVDLTRNAGGSSGGSAAAVASGLLPVAHASDGGGSVRIPASFCGLFGFKPSSGAVVDPYKRANREQISVVGAISRTVGDAAAFVDALARDFSPEGRMLAASRGAVIPPLRIKVVVTLPDARVDEGARDATLKTAALLESMGHHISVIEPIDISIDEFLPIWERQLAILPATREASLMPVTRWLRERGRKHTDADVHQLKVRLADRVDAWLDGADIILSPTVPEPAPRVGAFTDMPPEEA